MKNKKVIVGLLSAVMIMTACQKQEGANNKAEKNANTTVATTNNDRVKTYDDKKEITSKYDAKYELKKGDVYSLTCAHTHEKFMLIGFKNAKNVKDLAEDGKNVLSNKTETTVKSGEKIEVDENALYYFTMAHRDTKIDFTVPEDGEYVIFTDIAPGDALDFKIVKGEEELAPIENHTLDNSKNDIYHGYFEDSQVQDRILDDWQGEWKSVYPLLLDGSFDKVMEHKAESGKMTAQEYKDYYDVGYKTDVEKIKIDGNNITFTKDGKDITAEYKYDGYEILQYKKGNRGVRFLFTQTGKVDGAPLNIQFSDHNIYPTEATHFHLFFGDKSQEELLEEMDNWPTYYPVSYSTEDIVQDMLAH